MRAGCKGNGFSDVREPAGHAMKHFISIIIPNYNGSQTIGKCLESIFAFNNEEQEVIVVDDGSGDGSAGIIRKYPCRFIQLEKHSGASAARNAGAVNSTGDVLFFIDADCLLQRDTLAVIRENLDAHPADVVFGGTYTPVPYDPGFFNQFQSVFINYSETKNSGNPDYIATHAMVIHAETFKKIGGFTENFLPILEDVQFSHRLRRAGYRLLMIANLQVRHIFNFSFMKSLQNAARKTRYWTVYSLTNRDLLADSGTASREIKINGGVWLATVLLALLSLASGRRGFLAPLPFLWAFGIVANRRLFKAFSRAGGVLFASLAGMYYTIAYPAAVWIGALKGLVQYSVLNTIRPRGKETPQSPGPGI
jgi:glycosyltransferase involved in cell wall biosynthesis